MSHLLTCHVNLKDVVAAGQAAHLKKDAQLGDIPIQDIKKESPNMANKDVLATHKKWEDPGGGGDDRR